MAKISIDLKPFSVPNFVIVEDATCWSNRDPFNVKEIPLKDLPVDTLIEMCEEFREAVLEKASRNCDNKTEEVKISNLRRKNLNPSIGGKW